MNAVFTRTRLDNRSLTEFLAPGARRLRNFGFVNIAQLRLGDMMKKSFFCSAMAILIFSAGPAAAQFYNYGTGSNTQDHYVRGYERSDGHYVQPHYQTNPNNSTSDNYGARGNYNPHRGYGGY